MMMGTGPLTVLSLDLFCRRKKHTLSVKVIDRNCLPAFRSSVISFFIANSVAKKKLNTDNHTDRKSMPKKNFTINIPKE